MSADTLDSDALDSEATIQKFQKLVTDLPILNRHLLLYLLDLMAVFADKADRNNMTVPKLAAIFQPGILSHPEHRLSTNENQLSQDVLRFLIENQDHFLVGMAGTAVEDETV